MSERKVPERRCVGCMQSHPKKELIRIVRTEEGFAVDPGGRLPGRGCYLCKNTDCLKLAIKKNSIGRNLKTSAGREEYEKLVPQLEELIKQTSTREVF